VSVHLDEHQIKGAARLARTHRNVLAWDMGTGKTYAALAACVKPVLVVCPAYLVWNWVDEIGAMYPDWNVLVPQGPPKEKLRQMTQTEPALRDVTVVSYNVMADAKYSVLLKQRWGTVVFDEAHRLRGRNSARTKAAYKLQTEHLFALTGTSIVNNPGDLYPLLRLCNPRGFTSYWRFVEQWCTTKQTPWATEIVGVRDEEAFQDMIAPYVSQLELGDVYPEIPDAVWTKVPTLLTPKEREVHNTAKKTYRFRGEPLSGPGALVPALRNWTAASENKREALRLLLADHDDERIVVWVWYKESAALVCDHGVAQDRPCYIATGDYPITTRVEAVEKFLMSKNGVLVATIASLGEGFNLQGSNMAVFYELSYLAAENLQCIARQRRRGQQQSVNVYALVAAHSIDDAIYRVAQRRDATNSGARGVKAVLTELMRMEA